MTNYYFAVLLLLCSMFSSCDKPPNSIGSKSISIFKDTNLKFDMALKDQTEPGQDSIIRIDAGRVILKKVRLPKYEIQPEVIAHINLTSNGDPWDKSGSLFVIPNTSDFNLLSFGNEPFHFVPKSEYPGVTSYSTDSYTYQPNVELLRFMTPFGVGFFNNHEKTQDRKPVYIPEWEPEVNWTQNITHLLPLLEDEVYIGVFIDTWTNEGYNLSVDLEFKESTLPNHMKNDITVLPLVNTTKYASAQRNYDEFSRNPLSVTFELREPTSAELYYVVTGHGGHSEGDEFTKKENVISLDGQILKSFIPWRDDCASFRRYNPSSGVWMEKTSWKGEEIEERIASSDYSRSNWCPGSDVKPIKITLNNLEAGTHTLKINIPEAQPATDSEHNYWMVSAYLVY